MFSLEPVETWIKEVKIGNTSFIYDGFRTSLLGELILTPTVPGHPLYVQDETQAVHVAEEMLALGTAMLELSSTLLSTKSSITLVLSALKSLKETFLGVPLAVNTKEFDLVKATLNEGLVDLITIHEWSSRPELIEMLNEYPDVALVLSNDLLHQQVSTDDFVEATFNFFKSNLEQHGLLDRESVLLDLGVGLGVDKKLEMDLLGSLADLRNELELPVVVTVRWNDQFEDMTQLSIEERFSPLVAFASLAVLQGADVIRTRDVRIVSEMLPLLEYFKRHFGD